MTTIMVAAIPVGDEALLPTMAEVDSTRAPGRDLTLPVSITQKQQLSSFPENNMLAFCMELGAYFKVQTTCTCMLYCK